MALLVTIAMLTLTFQGVLAAGQPEFQPPGTSSRSMFLANISWKDPVSYSDLGWVSNPQISVSDNGTVFLTYTSWAYPGIYVSKMKPDGTLTVKDKQVVETGSAPAQYFPGLEYTQYSDLDANNYLHILGNGNYYRTDSDFTRIMGPIPIQTLANAMVAVQAGPDGTANFLYSDIYGYDHYSSVALNGSQPVNGATVSTNPAYTKFRFVVDDSSNLRVMGLSATPYNDDYLVIDSTGKIIKTTRIFNGATSAQTAADIALSPDGMTHIVWADKEAKGQIWYVRVNPAGIIDKGPINITTGTYTCGGYPKIAADPWGNAYIVWSEDSYGMQKIRLTRVDKGQYTSPGWSVMLANNTKDSLYPEIFIDHTGDVHIVYVVGASYNYQPFYVHGVYHKSVDAYFSASQKTKASKVFSGGSVTYNMTVRNNGTLNDTYDLKLLTSTQTGWTATFPYPNITVQANATVEIPITVKAPASAKDHDPFWVQAQIVSTNYTDLSKTTEKVTSMAVVDHKITLGLPSTELQANAGVQMVVNISVNNVGHSKEFLNLSAKAPANWTVDIGKGPGALRKMTMDLGTSVNISMKIVPGTLAFAGVSDIVINVAYDFNNTLATTGKVHVRLPILRGLTMVADRTNLTTRAFTPATFTMTVGNDDNTGSSYKIKMESYSDFSPDILNVTFSQNDFIVQARSKAIVLVNITPHMEGTPGQIISVSITASTENALPLYVTQNLSLSLGRSLLLIQTPQARKETEPGKTATFELNLFNVGDFDENITYSYWDLPTSWNSSITISGHTAPPTIFLPAGASATGVIYITVAPGNTYVGKNVTFHLYAKYGYIIFGLDLTIGVIDLTTNNTAPAFTSVPVTKAIANKDYLYQVKATDKDADLIVYSILTGPKNMSIDPSGLVSWTPAEQEVGKHNIVLRITDPKVSVDQAYTIEVLSSKYGHGLSVNVVNPSEGDVLKGPARISGIATFTDVGGYVEVSVDNGKWTKAKGNDLWYLDLDTASLKKGDHTVTARAINGNETSNVVTVHVTVKKTATAPKAASNDYLIPLLIIIIVLVVGLLLLARRRLVGTKAGAQASKPKARPSPQRVASVPTAPAPKPARPAPEPVIEEDVPEVEMEEVLEAPVSPPEPVVVAPVVARPREAPVKRPPPVERPRAPPPKGQKLSGELAELEKQFEEEELAKSASKPAPDKEDTDLDDILRKLSSPDTPKKGGGAK
jgi:uncharacterized membrane protein